MKDEPPPAQSTDHVLHTVTPSDKNHVISDQPETFSNLTRDTIGTSKQSTTEDELRSLSTTPRYSHEDLGRIVSPPDSDETDEILEDIDDTGDEEVVNDALTSPEDSDTTPEPVNTSGSVMKHDMSGFAFDGSDIEQQLREEQAKRKSLQKALKKVEDETLDLNRKVASLRVKLGVASSNYNVSKTECDLMRGKFQESEINKARLEERIKACSKDLDKLRDPSNPDSNVNLRTTIQTDRRTIRALRTEIEAVQTEQTSVNKQIEEKDETIKQLKALIGEANEQIEEIQQAHEAAVERLAEKSAENGDIEKQYDDLVKGKEAFDEKMAEIQEELDAATEGNMDIQRQYEEFKERETATQNKIGGIERKLKEILTEVEREKNHNMPQRTASSIKYHQYRLSRSSLVPDTTPHVVVAANPKGSVGASGFLGKTVISTKAARSLPGVRQDGKQAKTGKTTSLPSKN